MNKADKLLTQIKSLNENSKSQLSKLDDLCLKFPELCNRVDALEKSVKEGFKLGAEAKMEVKPQHFRDHLKGCSDCYVDVWKSIYAPKPYECSNCRMPLGEEYVVEKGKTCPGCGSKDARRRT